MSLTNVELAELLAIRADETEGHRSKAYQRAARTALTWEVEAADVVDAGHSPQELYNVGEKLAVRIKGWLEEPPEVPEPPPSRRNFSSFAAALKTLEGRPDWAERMRSDLQMHSHYSDGKETIFDMALASAEKGRTHILLTDHSKGIKIAGGIDESVLADQWREIDETNEELSRRGVEIEVLKGLELNIDLRGDGDMEPPAFTELDVVVGSFHSALRTTDDQTDRYLAALENPRVDIIGHPTGRKFNSRRGLKADWDAVCSTAATLGKALETNAYPDRQDLNIELLRVAASHGCHVSIGTDAHNVDELRFAPVGLAAVLTAGIEPDRVLNFMSKDELRAWASAN